VPSPIVVDVYAPQPRPQELSVLIAACSRAAAPNECITSDTKTTDSPLGVAIVRREGDRARIEIGLRNVASAEWTTRDLVFQAGDDELERYRAIGFAIGTLVARQGEPPATEPATPEAEPPKPAKVPPEPKPAAPLPPVTEPVRPTTHHPRATWVDLSGSVGLGLIPGPPRVGGGLRAGTDLVPRGLFAVAAVGYAERIGEPALRARWLNIALGLGHPLSPHLRALGVDLRLMFGLERLSVTAFDDERTAGDTRWKPGIVAGIDGHWNVARPLSLLLSADTFIDPRRTEIRRAGQSAGETPALGLTGFLGLRLRLR
jgi:hypothetical protein